MFNVFLVELCVKYYCLMPGYEEFVIAFKFIMQIISIQSHGHIILFNMIIIITFS